MRLAALLLLIVMAARLAASPGLARADDATRCFDTHDYAGEGTAPFPYQREAVERVWGEPIPDNLGLVGGVDWFGWAQLCRREGDPADIFRG